MTGLWADPGRVASLLVPASVGEMGKLVAELAGALFTVPAKPTKAWGGPTLQATSSLVLRARAVLKKGLLGPQPQKLQLTLHARGGGGWPPNLSSHSGHRSCFQVRTPPRSGHLLCFSIHSSLP